MSNVTHFAARFSSKTSEELQQMIDHEANYQPDAIEAAKRLLVERGSLDKAVLESDNQSPEEATEVPAYYASRTLRFVHYLIDFYFIQLITLAVSQGVSITGLLFNMVYTVDNTGTIAPLDFWNWTIITFLYYFMLEWQLQITVGKLVTKTIVVDKYGDKLSVLDALKRTVSRFIPFESFSCLSNPSRGWHDKLSTSFVINKSELELFKSTTKGDNVTNHFIV